MKQWTTRTFPVGEITLASDATGERLAEVWISGQRHHGFVPEGAERQRDGESPVLVEALDWLKRYFAGQAPDPLELPLAAEGTDFQQLVWSELVKIPYGQTTSYGAIARSVANTLGRPRMSAQAVGGAVGRNPISIIIPCHRVIGASGALTGYSGGVSIKQQLLAVEGVY